MRDLDLCLARRVGHIVEIALGSGCSRLIVGGTTPCLMAMAHAANSTPPAAPSKCPVIDLVELTIVFFALFAERLLDRLGLANIADGSRRAMRVDVINLVAG